MIRIGKKIRIAKNVLYSSASILYKWNNWGQRGDWPILCYIGIKLLATKSGPRTWDFWFPAQWLFHSAMPRSVPASRLLGNALEKIETYLASIFPINILEVGTVLADQARLSGRDLFCSSFSLALEMSLTFATLLFSSRKPPPTTTFEIVSLLLSLSNMRHSLALFLEFVFSICESNYCIIVKHWDNLHNTWPDKIEINYLCLNFFLSMYL